MAEGLNCAGTVEARCRARRRRSCTASVALDEPVVVLAFLLEVPRDKGVVPEGGSEHGEPLAFRQERPVANPDGRHPIAAAEVCDAAGLLTSGVPHARFALMESDPRVVPQGGCKGVVQRADALGGRDYVDVVKEREDGLAIEELALKVGKRRMLCQGIKRRHQRIACSPPSA